MVIFARMLNGAEIVTTNVFRQTADGYVKRIFLRIAERWWWLLAALPLTVIVLGMLVTPAFYYVAAMIVFLLFPTMLMFVFFSYALSPEVRKVIGNKRIVFGIESFVIEHCPDDENDEATTESKQICIDCSTIRNAELHKEVLLIITGLRMSDFVEIPISAFACEEDKTAVIELLSNVLNQKNKI